MAVSDYSMFDVQEAKEQQSHKTGYEVSQIPRGRVSIYASSVGGDLYNKGLMGLAGMLGGAPSPEVAKQQAITEIQERFPNPDTYEEFMELANALRMGGFYSFSEQAIKAANEIKSSQPAKSNAWKEYTEMTSNPTPQGFQIWYDKYKVTGGSKPTSYQEYALTTQDPSTEGYAEWMVDKADGDDEPNYILDDFIQTSYDTLLEENPTMDKKDLLNKSNVAGQKLFDEYETDLEIAREGGNFLNQIKSLQSIINPDTIEGKPLYDKKDPNGRFYTEAEAVEQAKHNIRLGEDQIFSQLVDKTNLENTGAYHLESTQSADTARATLRDLNEMLQLLQMGANTGFSQDFKDTARSALLSFGFTDDDLAVNEVLRTKMKKLALDRLSSLKGAASDKDIDFVEAAGLQMNKSKLANKVIVEIAQLYAQDEIDLYYQMNGWIENYKAANRGRHPSLNVYKAKEKEFIDSKDHISKRVGVTMEQLLAIEPDWEYTDTSATTVNNSLFLDGLIEKHSGS